MPISRRVLLLWLVMGRPSPYSVGGVISPAPLVATPRPGGADRGRDEGSLRYFILPRAFASLPSSCGMPCGHLPRTLRGQFGKQPYREHRALRPGGQWRVAATPLPQGTDCFSGLCFSEKYKTFSYGLVHLSSGLVLASLQLRRPARATVPTCRRSTPPP